MGDSAQQQLAVLQQNLSQLSREAIILRETFANDYRKQDNVVSSLNKVKKLFKECKTDTRLAKKKGLDVSELEELIQEIEPMLNDLKQRLVPATGSLFVRLFLGRVNVKIYKDGERFRLKSEYEKFRSRTNPFIIFAACVQLLLPRQHILQGLFQTWLLYYYCTLALREQILRVNGSNINKWWIFHHYLCILSSMIMLTWYFQSDSYQFCYPLLMKYAMYQGLVQVLMNKYQIGRLYNLVARGKATRMDVTTDIVDKRFAVSMAVLLPFLVIGNCAQSYLAYSMLNYGWNHYPHVEWQLFAVGTIFIIFAIGNLWTALGSSISKYLRKNKEE